MALTATVYHLQIDLSDVERDVYQKLDLRIARHPSETMRYLLARTLAARYLEQRRIEDDRDRQSQQVRDSQRRIEQLNDRLEALRAIERSVSRQNAPAPAAAPASGARPPGAQ